MSSALRIRRGSDEVRFRRAAARVPVPVPGVSWSGVHSGRRACSLRRSSGAGRRDCKRRKRWEQLAAMGVVGLTAPGVRGWARARGGRPCRPARRGGTGRAARTARRDHGSRRSSARGHRVAGDWRGIRPARGDGGDGPRLVAAHRRRAKQSPRCARRRVAGGLGGRSRLLVVFASEHGSSLPAAAEVDVTPVGSIDPTRRLATVDRPRGCGFGPVRTAPAHSGPITVDRLAPRGAFAVAAVLLGAADRLISFAREHALERQQFGRPIGSFQAVKHHLASAYVKLEMARPLIYRAAWSLDDGRLTRRAWTARLRRPRVGGGTEAARVALQVHGAMGYTWEHDLHMWMKRIWVLASSWGIRPPIWPQCSTTSGELGRGTDHGPGPRACRPLYVNVRTTKMSRSVVLRRLQTWPIF